MATIEIDCKYENIYARNTDTKRHFYNENGSYKKKEIIWDYLTELHESALNGGGIEVMHKFQKELKRLKKTKGIDTEYFEDFVKKEIIGFPLLYES